MSLPTPAVSVIMPTKDRPHLLRRALASALAQTMPALEVIVVNDAGCDVQPVVSGFGDARVRVATHPENRGLAASRNTGLRTARAPLVAYLDDDDWWQPDHLAIACGALGRAGARFVYTDGHEVLERETDGELVEVERRIVYSNDFDLARMCVDNLFPCDGVLHERALLGETGLFDEAYRVHEDWELWLRMARRTALVHVPETTFAYSTRVGTDGNMRTQNPGRFLDTFLRTHLRLRDVAAGLPGVLVEQRAERERLFARTLTFLDELPAADPGLPSVIANLVEIAHGAVRIGDADDLRGAGRLLDRLLASGVRDPRLRSAQLLLLRHLGEPVALLAVVERMIAEQNGSLDAQTMGEIVRALELLGRAADALPFRQALGCEVHAPVPGVPLSADRSRIPRLPAAESMAPAHG